MPRTFAGAGHSSSLSRWAPDWVRSLSPAPVPMRLAGVRSQSSVRTGGVPFVELGFGPVTVGGIGQDEPLGAELLAVRFDESPLFVERGVGEGTVEVVQGVAELHDQGVVRFDFCTA